MRAGRLEAFSDGVLAVIITIMVLELKAPHAPELEALRALVPTFVCYVISFIYVGIYWNNHHHLMHLAQKVNGAVLWANLHVLFWLSLIPFVSSWMSENPQSAVPVAAYGCVLLMSGFAYVILVRALTHVHGKNSALEEALGSDLQGKISLVLYAIGVGAAFENVYVSYALYIAVAGIWLIPDTRIEKRVHD